MNHREFFEAVYEAFGISTEDASVLCKQLSKDDKIVGEEKKMHACSKVGVELPDCLKPLMRSR
jgi:hypothetical protein